MLDHLVLLYEVIAVCVILCMAYVLQLIVTIIILDSSIRAGHAFSYGRNRQWATFIPIYGVGMLLVCRVKSSLKKAV